VVYASREKFAQAEPLYRRSLALRQKATVESMNNQALALDGKGDNAAAERLYRRAITLAERIPAIAGPANVDEAGALASTLRNYAILLHKLKRGADAGKIEARLKPGVK
jgi:Flp pilus assembly protein TadD